MESGTEYLYRIQTTAFSDVYRFKTAGTGPFSFMHITDIHSYLPIPSRVSTANTVLNKAATLGENMAFTLISGDATAYGTVYEQWEELYKMNTVKTMPYVITPVIMIIIIRKLKSQASIISTPFPIIRITAPMVFLALLIFQISKRFIYFA